MSRSIHWLIRQASLSFLGFTSYEAYLTSPLWQTIRSRVFAAKGPLCVCERPASQVHHMAYSLDVMSGHNLEPLIPICRGCHRRIHRRGRSGPAPTLNEANRRLADCRDKRPHHRKPYRWTPREARCMKTIHSLRHRVALFFRYKNFSEYQLSSVWKNMSSDILQRHRLCRCGESSIHPFLTKETWEGLCGDDLRYTCGVCGSCWERMHARKKGDMAPSLSEMVRRLEAGPGVKRVKRVRPPDTGPCPFNL